MNIGALKQGACSGLNVFPFVLFILMDKELLETSLFSSDTGGWVVAVNWRRRGGVAAACTHVCFINSRSRARLSTINSRSRGSLWIIIGVACFLVGIENSLFGWSVSFVSSMLKSSVKLLEGTSSEVVHGGGELVNQDAGVFVFWGGWFWFRFVLCSLQP